MTSLPCGKLLLKGLVFKSLHKGVGGQFSQGLILKTTTIIINNTKTQERTGVLFVGLENGGGIVMVATKPHESHLNVERDIQISEPIIVPS